VCLMGGVVIAQSDGEKLFKQYCTACHRADDRKLIGSGLAGVTKRVPSKEWFIKWVKNSQSLIQAGDEYGVKIFNEYNKVVMPPQPLTDEQILAIWDWLEKGPAPSEQAPVAATETKLTTPPEKGLPISTTTIILILGIVILFVVYIILGRVHAYLRKVEAEKLGIPLPEERRLTPYQWFREHKRHVAVVLLFGFGVFCIVAWNWMWDIGVYQGYQPPQPIAFSHKVHAGKLGIPCEYCHSAALSSRYAGVPPVSLCMNCHRVIDRGTTTGTTEIAKIYAAVGWDPEKQQYTGKVQPVEWIRVHKLPELAYFNHSQHVVVGQIKCQTCHGPVEEMDVVYQFSDLTMGWCINCHRTTEVKTEGNAYYTSVVERIRAKKGEGPIHVSDIGGLECYKCHY